MPHVRESVSAPRSTGPSATCAAALALVAALASPLSACGDRGGAGQGAESDTGRGGRADADGDAAPTNDADSVRDATAVFEVSLDVPGTAEDTTAAVDASDATGDTSGAETGEPVDTVCRDVDLLFVVDNSASMDDQQRSLIASFPGFIEGIRARLQRATSLHVGVVTTDNHYGNGEGCTDIGDLVTRTRGLRSSDSACGPYWGDTRYIDGLDPDLDASFACAAQLGVTGDDNERAMRALLNALQPARSEPDACNAGFLRPDSLLIVVLITDEDDAPEEECDPDDFGCTPSGSGGRVDDWMAELATVRPTWRDDMIVLSLIQRYPDSRCGAQQAARLVGFTLRFGDRGFIGDICDDDYGPFFASSLPVLDDACKPRGR